MKRALLIAGIVLGLPGLTPPARAQDADAGKAVFKSICNLCHEAAEGRNRVGPSLFGVIGRKSGSVPGFTYSEVLKGAGLVWADDTLDKWINSPQSTVPGTRMIYTGLKDQTKRRDLIAYLKTLHH